MSRTDAAAWVLSLCIGCLRASQAKTLAAVVTAAMGAERVSLATLGRSMGGETLVKHQIKRVYRFLSNERVEPVDVMRGVVPRWLRRWPANRPLLVGFDWTDVRGLQTLMAAAVIGGRAVPLCWASCTKHTYDGHRSRNAFEESLLLALRAMLPEHVKPILLADRGFGRTELGRFCQRHKIGYVIRIQPKVWITHGTVRCRLDRYPVKRGIARRLDGVLYRQRDPVRQHVVIRWKKGLPKRRDECWYLMTDLAGGPWTARRVSDLYARRMSVEELFRDHKSTRNGWALRLTMVRRADRLDRLILVLALAYLLLAGLGLIARQRLRPAAWSSNTRATDLSVFAIGRVMLDRLRVPIRSCLAAVLDALQTVGPNWG